MINPASDPGYRDYVATLLTLAGRKGMTPEAARTLVRTNATVIGAVALQRGNADAIICGLEGRFKTRLRLIRDIVGWRPASPNSPRFPCSSRSEAIISSLTRTSARTRLPRSSPR